MDSRLHYHRRQTYACRDCRYMCCRYFEVNATAAEAKSISALRYGNLDPSSQPCFSPIADTIYCSVNKNPSGDCVFIDGDGLCAIHRRSGISAKPLACRMFPFTIHNWTDGVISADMRYICPSVGKPAMPAAETHEKEIFKMAAAMKKREQDSDAVYSQANPAPLQAVRMVHQANLAMITQDKFPLSLRLYAIARSTSFHSSPEMHSAITHAGPSFRSDALEFMDKASDAMKEELEHASRPDLSVRIDFRNLLSGYVRDDSSTGKKVTLSAAARLRNAWRVLRFGLGRASLKDLNPTCPDSSGYDCFRLTGLTLSAEADAARYEFILAKMHSMHFCGRHYHRYTYEEGIRHFLLSVPAAHAMAALFAAASNSAIIEFKHMRDALSYIDTAFSISPFFRSQVVRNKCARLTSPNIYAAILKTFK